MRKLNLSSVEYQGISIIKKDYITIQKIINRYYKNVRAKDNLHLCLQYFGLTKKIDDCIKKELSIIPFEAIGKQIKLPIIGIGEYRKNGKIMNIALLVDDTCFMDIFIKDKMLFDYMDNTCPNITVYTCPDTYIDEKNRIRHVTAVKKSDKCFMKEKLEEGETSNLIMFDDPIIVIGQLCFFHLQNPAFHININTPRLITKEQLSHDVNELLHANFQDEWKEEREQKAKELEEKILNGGV